MLIRFKLKKIKNIDKLKVGNVYYFKSKMMKIFLIGELSKIQDNSMVIVNDGYDFLVGTRNSAGMFFNQVKIYESKYYD